MVMKNFEGFVAYYIANTPCLFRKMSVQEIKSYKFSPAARYTKESLGKSIDQHLLKGYIFNTFFIRPKGGNFFRVFLKIFCR